MRRLPDLTSIRWKLVAFVSPELVGAALAVLFALVALAALLPGATSGAGIGSPVPSP